MIAVWTVTINVSGPLRAGSAGVGFVWKRIGRSIRKEGAKMHESPECARGEHHLCKGEYVENGHTHACLCIQCRHGLSKPTATTSERKVTGIYTPGWKAPRGRTDGPPRRGY